jgi:hypothetical protein
MGLVRPARLNEDIKWLALAFGAFKRRLLTSVLEDDIERDLVPKLKRREDLAHVLARLAEYRLDGFE